jgi:peptide/nickel transport system permease protein
MLMGQRSDLATQQNIKAELYLDQPLGKQLLFYLNDISPISIYSSAQIQSKNLKGFFWGTENKKIGVKVPYLRRSYQSKKDVMDILMDALPGTLMLASASMLLAILLGIPLGVLSAIKKDTWWDSTALFTSILGISAPSFFMGIIISYLFGVVWSNVTGLHMNGSWITVDAFTGPHISMKNLILPAITLGIRPLAIITQLTRSAMLDAMQQDYIRTARAKGIKNIRIIWHHAFRNALNPVITAVTGWFAELLAGSFFVETIFGWKGIGKITVDALEKLDFPIVIGAVLLTSFFVVCMNLIADLLYAYTDPRIRLH